MEKSNKKKNSYHNDESIDEKDDVLTMMKKEYKGYIEKWTKLKSQFEESVRKYLLTKLVRENDKNGNFDYIKFAKMRENLEIEYVKVIMLGDLLVKLKEIMLYGGVNSNYGKHNVELMKMFKGLIRSYNSKSEHQDINISEYIMLQEDYDKWNHLEKLKQITNLYEDTLVSVEKQLSSLNNPFEVAKEYRGAKKYYEMQNARENAREKERKDNEKHRRYNHFYNNNNDEDNEL